MTTPAHAPALLTIPHLVHDARNGSSLLWKWAIAFFALFVVVYLGTFIDARLFNGVSVWEKPAKFFLSLSLHMATLAWGLSLLPTGERQAPVIRIASIVFLAAASFEMFYITLQASRGEASHFNEATAVTLIMYALMGFGAVVLALVTVFVGWRVLKRAPESSIAFATGLGFIMGGVLAIVFGGYMSQQGSHWVGGNQTDATGLAFFHWSTTGGDLRVAHFFGLHSMQALPILGFLCGLQPIHRARRIIVAGAGLWVALVIACFVQALFGHSLMGT